MVRWKVTYKKWKQPNIGAIPWYTHFPLNHDYGRKVCFLVAGQAAQRRHPLRLVSLMSLRLMVRWPRKWHLVWGILVGEGIPGRQLVMCMAAWVGWLIWETKCCFFDMDFVVFVFCPDMVFYFSNLFEIYFAHDFFWYWECLRKTIHITLWNSCFPGSSRAELSFSTQLDIDCFFQKIVLQYEQKHSKHLGMSPCSLGRNNDFCLYRLSAIDCFSIC